MQKNKNITIICGWIAFLVFPFLGMAQMTDVFQNKEYKFSNFILEAETNVSYAPGKFQIYQHKNEEKNANWEKIEQQLFDLAKQQIDDEAAFFKLYNKAVQYQTQKDEQKRLEYRDVKNSQPTFEKIEIQWLSVVNGFGVYRIQYNFDEVQVQEYYLADYSKNRLTKINQKPNAAQQQALKDLTLNEFTAIYLIHTKKLDLNNPDRIRSTRLGAEKAPDFASRLHYSEAVVYPIFSGLMVEFPAYTHSYEVFYNDAFRVFIKGKELKNLLTVYPEYSPIFQKKLSVPSAEIIHQLVDEENFNLLKFQRAPKELQLLETLKPNNKTKNLFALQIKNYSQRDTSKVYLGSIKYFFDRQEKLLRIERRNYRDDLSSEDKYGYDSENQLTDVFSTGFGNRLKLYNYQNGLLSHYEDIDRSDYRTAWGEEMVDLGFTQEHYTYHSNSRYAFRFNLVGKMEERDIHFSKRSITSTGYCTEYNCLITDKNGNITAIKVDRSSLIDILVNDQNQPMETFIDNDRHHYRFQYDSKNRIKSFNQNNIASPSINIEYQYADNLLKPLILTERRSDNVILQEYELEFWEQ